MTSLLNNRIFGAAFDNINPLLINASPGYVLSVSQDGNHVVLNPPNAGPNGLTGPTGPTGQNGTNGTNGATSATGPTGQNGNNGAKGATGPKGDPGTNGTNGTNGLDGPTGPTGPVLKPVDVGSYAVFRFDATPDDIVTFTKDVNGYDATWKLVSIITPWTPANNNEQTGGSNAILSATLYIRIS